MLTGASCAASPCCVASVSAPFPAGFGGRAGSKNEAGEFRELGRTEVAENNHNPDWVRQFLLDYHFETIQEFRVSVYDEDSKGNPDLAK